MNISTVIRRRAEKRSVFRQSEIRRVGSLAKRLLAEGRKALRFSALQIALSVAVLVFANPAHAVRPDEMLADPKLEVRAREVGQELRCLVCRNQSIEDSDADLAHDLRVLVRERIKAGGSNDQVIAFIRSRYGDFVLLRPPFETGTLLLWSGPALILLLGGFGIHRYYRNRRRGEEAPPALSADERRRLKAVLDTAEPEARA